MLLLRTKKPGRYLPAPTIMTKVNMQISDGGQKPLTERQTGWTGQDKQPKHRLYQQYLPIGDIRRPRVLLILARHSSFHRVSVSAIRNPTLWVFRQGFL